MPSTSRFVANKAGFTSLAVGPGARTAVVTEARKGEAIAVGLSAEFRRTGAYQDSFEVSELSVLIDGLPRAGARLENTSDHAAAVEVGNAATKGKGHHVLSRTLDALAGA